MCTANRSSQPGTALRRDSERTEKKKTEEPTLLPEERRVKTLRQLQRVEGKNASGRTTHVSCERKGCRYSIRVEKERRRSQERRGDSPVSFFVAVVLRERKETSALGDAETSKEEEHEKDLKMMGRGRYTESEDTKVKVSDREAAKVGSKHSGAWKNLASSSVADSGEGRRE